MSDLAERQAVFPFAAVARIGPKQLDRRGLRSFLRRINKRALELRQAARPDWLLLSAAERRELETEE